MNIIPIQEARREPKEDLKGHLFETWDILDHDTSELSGQRQGRLNFIFLI